MRLDECARDAAELLGVYSPDMKTAYAFTLEPRYRVRVPDAAGRSVRLKVKSLPAPLLEGGDEPVFSESAADPMIYISLACARLWMADRRPNLAQMWLLRYYQLLRGVSSSARGARHVLPAGTFR